MSYYIGIKFIICWIILAGLSYDYVGIIDEPCLASQTEMQDILHHIFILG